jgi:uncharacterized repeat protein (TIGR03803 family)
MYSAQTESGVKDSPNISRFQWKSIFEDATDLATITALVLMGALTLTAAPAALATTESVVHNFAANGTDGYYPYAGLTTDAAGNLYGTTYYGGAHGYGTVYKVTPTGTETVLHSFAAGADGAYPYFAGVVLDKAGNIYGTTTQGGTNNLGTVFKLTPSGTETVLHSFVNDGTDGYYPEAGVVLDRLGNVYGTTYVGGAHGYGTVYKVTPTGTETVLHSFAGGTGDGCYPYFGDGVVLGPKNILYGTTYTCGANGYGTVYKLTKTGTETVLHSFAPNGTDGYEPFAGVVLDKLGNLYGTTIYGGVNNAGTVYKLTPTGTETVIHSFAANGTDGYYPEGAGVILDKLGNLYGTTTQGGTNGIGTVFKITSSGTETVLHSFINDGTDGYSPYAGVVLGKKNTLYGTTLYGGKGYGTVYKVVP